MLRHARLRDVELALNRLDDLTGRPGALHEQLEDPAPNGAAEDVEGLRHRRYPDADAVSAGSPVYAAVVRAAAARAAAASVPASMDARHQSSLLWRTNSRPFSDPSHAIPSRGSTAIPVSRYRPSPRSAVSQPTPTAPGPNSFHRGSGTRATCSSRRSERPSGVASSVTSSQVTSPPNSHVMATTRGGSHRVIVPPALPWSW